MHYAPCNGIDAGEKYLPTTVSISAIHYYEEYQQTHDTAIRIKFFNCIDWLIDHRTIYGAVAFYEMNWQQPFYPSVRVPWRSGLASGTAIEAFSYAYELTKEAEYLNYAKELLRGFYVPIQQGGFTYMEPNGWWYEEYADTNMNTPRVLNGHIGAFLGIGKYWQVTKDDSAALIYENGKKALKTELNKYEMGDGWSYYDRWGKKSDKKYQKVVVDQMEQMWKITGDTIFYDYYKKWNTPLEEFYGIRMVKEKNRSAFILLLLTTLAFWALLSIAYNNLRR